MAPSVISIDLGASFTKVGFRTACAPTPKRPYTEDARLLVLDGSVLIPSLAIFTDQKRRPWLFGSVAADTRPDDKMVVVQNWKADLFRKESNESAQVAALVAHEFFVWLKPQLELATGPLENHQVRVMLPALDDFPRATKVIKKAILGADWSPSGLLFATEPHANAIGVLTRGCNVVIKRQAGVFPNLGEMLGRQNPYLEMARAAVLGSSKRRTLRLVLIDIGAFTTDVASLQFNVLAPADAGDGLMAVQQRSFEIGTARLLDEPFWNRLGEHHDADFSSMSFREREEFKRALLDGQSFSVNVGNRPTIFGDETDRATIGKIAASFAEAIWRAVEPMIKLDSTDVIFLTGGGAAIGPLVEKLKGFCPFLDAVHSKPLPATDPDKPPRCLAWSRTDGVLERVATALGGASVLSPRPLDSDLLRDPSPKSRARKTDVDEDYRLRPCSCRGNSDCPRCGGSGYLN